MEDNKSLVRSGNELCALGDGRLGRRMEGRTAPARRPAVGRRAWQWRLVLQPSCLLSPMADPFYTPNIPSVSSAHKRPYAAMDPDLDGRPVGTSRRNPSLASSSSPSGSRERNKRPRNNSESEVDDILVSSNASMSSSGSSISSVESYHSARSSFADISPPLLPADEAPAGQLPLLVVPTTLLEQTEEADVPMDDVSMDDVLSFVTRQDPVAPPPAPTLPPAPDRNEEMRRAMERVDAFEREMSALRQSPANRPPRWTPFNPGLEELSGLEGSWLVLVRAFSWLRMCPRNVRVRSRLIHRRPLLSPSLPSAGRRHRAS